jgi:biopolymer transport protein ExbD
LTTFLRPAPKEYYHVDDRVRRHHGGNQHDAISDVLLVLLIIFLMLAAPVTPPGFTKQFANWRDLAAPPPLTTRHSVEVLVRDDNRIVVDGQQSDLAQIYADMRAVTIRRGHIHVALTANVQSQYGVTVRILDAAKAAGLNDVGLISW